MYSVNNSDVIESFYEIRNDMVRLTNAAHFIDIINDIVQENQPAQRVLRLLLNSLHMLAKTDKSSELIARIFEIRLLSINGYEPYINDCIICGNNDFESCSFSFQKCGFICDKESCISNDRFTMQLCPGTVKTIRHIINSPMNNLFSFNSSPMVLDELGKLTRRYLKERLERDYNKLDFLKKIEK
jgi:DNA repair protein RecO (recombination protein O)